MKKKNYPVKFVGRLEKLKRQREDVVPFNEMQVSAINAYISLLKLKNYADNTIKTYRNWFLIFLKNFPATNLKHKTILCLAYATGIRISEVVALKIADIDSDRMVINIRQGKGR